MNGDTDNKPRGLTEPQDNDFEKLYEKGFQEFHEGELIKGHVVKITSDSVIVDIAYKSEGIVPLKEFLDKDGHPLVTIGQEISVLFEKCEDELGYVMLSKAKADNISVWDELIDSFEKHKNVEGVITRRINGGFHVDVKGVVAFLPISHADIKLIKNPDSMLGLTFSFRILQHNRNKNNVIVSRKIILEEERDMLKKDTLEKIEEGAVMEGVVKNIVEYGAFVDMGGLDGLLHLSDISWGKVAHPSQILKIGDRINVKILKFDRAEMKISLGIKQIKPDPWRDAKEKYPPGAKVKGRVTNLTDYGAFVEIVEGLEGLIHISEMCWTKIKHPSQKLKIGDVVTAMVLDLDPLAKRISLSLKQVEANPWEELAEKYPKGSSIKGIVKNITDFGLFVGVESGIDGLVHISDLTWKKIKHPSELFKKGDEVNATVLNVDKETRRFSLSTKSLEKNPWEGVGERLRPGMTVSGKVTGMAEFGAFVELEPGTEGLIHVSELERARLSGKSLKPGDVVEVEILNVNIEEKKIGLSMRKVVGASSDEK